MGVHSNYNELQPVRNDVYHAVCATSVRTVFCIHSPSVVFFGGLISMVGGRLSPPPLASPLTTDVIFSCCRWCNWNKLRWTTRGSRACCFGCTHFSSVQGTRWPHVGCLHKYMHANSLIEVSHWLCKFTLWFYNTLCNLCIQCVPKTSTFLFFE